MQEFRPAFRHVQHALKLDRQEAGLREVDMAKALKMPQAYVSKYE